MTMNGAEYRIAFARESGTWETVETFNAISDEAANAYAAANYADQEWYVLDSAGGNVNG
jgi:hypothetical protein